MNFGDILRELLEDNDITQKQLAAELNIGATTVGNYIRGLREPDFDILKRLAAYFHVTTDYLLNFQSGKTDDHGEDELLRLYRSLPAEQKKLFLDQGKLLMRYHAKDAAAPARHRDKNNAQGNM